MAAVHTKIRTFLVFLAIGLLALAGCSNGEEAKDEEESQAPSQEEVQSA